MRRGRHAADDGSFGRSAGTALGRGLLLLAVAVLIGVFLLNRVDDPPAATNVSSGDGGAAQEPTTTTTAPTERSTTTTAAVRAPKDVRVLTANGTAVRGAGGRVKDRLFAAGYNTLPATDASTKPAQTAVFFAAGFDREAIGIAQLLGVPAQAVQAMPATPPVSDLKGANVLVVVGNELAQQSGGTTTTTRAGAGTTTTTARSGTTTTTTR